MSTTTDVVNPKWQKLVAPYSEPDVRQSVWQVVNTLVPYFVMWGVMFWSLRVSYWLTLLLAIPTAGLMMRTFIIFHDCCHGSFFKSWKANETLGVILGVLTVTPYYHWRHDHAVHHASAGNLDRRGIGDVPTWTVEEYRNASWSQRAGYRFIRQPLIMFTIGSTVMFLVIHRLGRGVRDRQELANVWVTNFVLLAIAVGLSLAFGFKAMVMVVLPVFVIGSGLGVWLFYVQHQFEGVYWKRKDEWSFYKAGLAGSSYYKLPRVLNWFSGNIGYHHIHHLSPKIPNYKLPQCHEANPAFQVDPLTIPESLKSLHLRLLDEPSGQMVGFDFLKQGGAPTPA
jgi:omega-6 fatty acid desaturase (delta-12 desaturase)